jgi:dTDP-4-dehydrorhamnose 3,5-epimerase
LIITPTPIDAVRIVQPRRIGDARGWFEETWRADAFAAAGIDVTFVQDNQSFSAKAGTVRGLHFQLPPFAQAKLVRVVSGAILDVAVDLRRGSPTFGRHVAVRLDSENGTQLFIPVGFAHGFCTLVENTAVSYKVSGVYSREHDRGMRWNDPALGIDWPVSEDEAQLSDKDRIAPLLAELGDRF